MKTSRIKKLKDKDVCIRCEMEICYSEMFDAQYCEKCNIWLEERCVDPLCCACSKRPIRPIAKTKTKLKKIKKPNKKKKEIVEWEI